MLNLEDLYFTWLMSFFDNNGVRDDIVDISAILSTNDFTRRVGNDVNRADDGVNLRREFLNEFEASNFDPNVSNHLLNKPCSWLEMLVALVRELDYLYDGGVEHWFIELTSNMGLGDFYTYTHPLSSHPFFEFLVEAAVNRVNSNDISPTGEGGLFPLSDGSYPDQKLVEIWTQHAAYVKDRY